MGCPDIYYKKALKLFARNLIVYDDKQKAETLYKEDNVSVLEEEVDKQREIKSTEEFFFEAGMACGMILQQSNTEDCCDGFNACLGGISMFEDFVMQKEEDGDDE